MVGDFPRIDFGDPPPLQKSTKFITGLLQPTFVDDTGCFVLRRPSGRRGVLSIFEGGVPKVYSRKDPIVG